MKIDGAECDESETGKVLERRGWKETERWHALGDRVTIAMMSGFVSEHRAPSISNSSSLLENFDNKMAGRDHSNVNDCRLVLAHPDRTRRYSIGMF